MENGTLIIKGVSHSLFKMKDKTLLNKQGIYQVKVSGDRYDKVFEDSIHSKEIPYINSFKGSHPYSVEALIKLIVKCL